jgi:hypothetical protein
MLIIYWSSFLFLLTLVQIPRCGRRLREVVACYGEEDWNSHFRLVCRCDLRGRKGIGTLKHVFIQLWISDDLIFWFDRCRRSIVCPFIKCSHYAHHNTVSYMVPSLKNGISSQHHTYAKTVGNLHQNRIYPLYILIKTYKPVYSHTQTNQRQAQAQAHRTLQLLPHATRTPTSSTIDATSRMHSSGWLSPSDAPATLPFKCVAEYALLLFKVCVYVCMYVGLHV